MPEAVPTPAPDAHSDAAELPVNDPRRATRSCVRRLFHCRLAPAAGGPDLAVMVVDYSPLGLLLMAAGRLECGEAAVVRIAGAGPERPASDLAVRVAHCEDKGTGCFAVGVEFSPPLTYEGALALLDRLGPAPGAPRR
jgi:hypothetical protein